jgi:hypothetical protein
MATEDRIRDGVAAFAAGTKIAKASALAARIRTFMIILLLI